MRYQSLLFTCLCMCGFTFLPACSLAGEVRDPDVPASSPPPATGLPRQQEDRGVINPKTGEYLPPSGKGVINPRTGDYYFPSGRGYFNPRTGEFIPGKP